MEDVILVERPDDAPAAGDRVPLIPSRARAVPPKTPGVDVGDTPGPWATSAKVIAMLRLD